MIVTFYSYKGGTGRTMALANIAVLLAKAGRRVLMVDFDLEAPGVWRYFADIHAGLDQQPGLLELLRDHGAGAGTESPDWHDYTTRIRVGVESVALMTTGRQDADYPAHVLAFDWPSFFASYDGGLFFERLRQDWNAEYDVVLIDSRTGITDIGGICTIALPDLIVPVFVANRQNVDGVVDVLRRAQAGRQALAYDRSPALVLPLLSRFDSRTELEFVNEWLSIAAQRFGEFYADWLPRRIDARVALERTKLPYVAYFGFGEKLAVSLQGTTDPDSLGYALDTVAQLIDSRLQDLSRISPARPIVTPPTTAIGPHNDSWIAAVYRRGNIVGMAFAVDRYRLLTPGYNAQHAEGLTVRFLKVSERDHIRVAEVRYPSTTDFPEAVVLVLDQPIPDSVELPRLSFAKPAELVGHRWWSFGLTQDSSHFGTAAYGTIMSTLTFGLVQVDPSSRRGLGPGFGGAPLWSPEHNAVVGMIVQAGADGDGAAVTIQYVDTMLPNEHLRLLTEPIPRFDLGPHETLQLAGELGRVFFSEADAMTLLESTAYPLHLVPQFASFGEPALFWEAILRQLLNGAVPDGPRRLVLAAQRLYPGNRTFQQLAASLDSS